MMPELRIPCCVCAKNSIPRPEGATPATTYTCARCCERMMRARNGEIKRKRRAEAHPWRTYQTPMIPKEILQANSRADSIIFLTLP